MKNKRHITACSFNCRDSADFGVSTFNKPMCNLTDLCFEIGNKNIPPIRWTSLMETLYELENINLKI